MAARKYPSHLDLIATLSEVIEKLALGHGLADHLVDLGADQAPPCGAAFLLGPPFAVLPGLPTLRIFNNRKAILPTKSIGGFLHLVVILFRAVVFEAVQKRHRINHKMIVQVAVLVQMGGNDDLVLIAPKLLCQLHPDFMGHFRRGFSGGKGLVAVVGHGAVLFAEPLFDSDHFFTGGGRVAVDAGNKLLHGLRGFICCLGFFTVHGVINDIRKSLSLPVCHILTFIKSRVLRLVRVLHINDHLAQPPLDPPDGCGSHIVTPHYACRFCRKRQKAHRSVGVPLPTKPYGFAGSPYAPSAWAGQQPQ